MEEFELENEFSLQNYHEQFRIKLNKIKKQRNRSMSNADVVLFSKKYVPRLKYFK